MRSVVVLLLGCASSEAPPGAVDANAAVDAAPAEVVLDAAPCRLEKPFSTKNAACNTCAEKNCCAEVNACLTDKRCDDDYVNCALACALLPADAGDAGAERDRCLAECAAMHPEGRALYDRTFACIESKCAVCN